MAKEIRLRQGYGRNAEGRYRTQGVVETGIYARESACVCVNGK